MGRVREYVREKKRWRRRVRRYLLSGVSAGFCVVAGVALWNRPDPYDLAAVAAAKDGSRRLSGATEVCDEDTIMVLPYLALILYMFFGLAIICDEFFEPSLSTISERLHLTPDVAGTSSASMLLFACSPALHLHLVPPPSEGLRPPPCHGMPLIQG